MGRKRRWLEDEPIIFVTGRTLQEQFLLKPSPLVRQLCEFWLAKAQEKFPVVLYAYVFQSNHHHILGADPHGNWAQFMQYWRGQLAVDLNEQLGRHGPFWHDRYHMQHVLDDDAALAKVIYTLMNPVQDRLVTRVAQWEGASSYEYAVTGRTRTIEFFDRVEWRKAGKPKDRKRFRIRREIKVSPLPGLTHLSPKRRQNMLRKLIEEAEAECAREHRAAGKRVMTKAQRLKVNPFHRPRQPKWSPEPLCHTTDPELRREFRERWRQFNEEYDEAVAFVRGGKRTIGKARFPKGSFPPQLPRSWPRAA